MLSKESCSDAMNAWNIIRNDYSEIEKIIKPTSIFSFSKENCLWLKNHNHNSSFHIYMGIHENKLIAILIPLDSNGKEVDLSSYVTSELAPLHKEVVLLEKQVIEHTNKVVLSTDLQVQYNKKEILFPFQNAPAIRESTSVKEILSWKNNCLDWFYHECREQGGERIFRAFKVPVIDLVKTDPADVYCFFGFKYSPIYGNIFPALIFVELTAATTESNIECFINSPSQNEIDDFARPCPPFNNEMNRFEFLQTAYV